MIAERSEHVIQLLTFGIAISGPADVVESLSEAFPASDASADSKSEISIKLLVKPSDTSPGGWHVIRDDETVQSFDNPADLQTYLIWLINSEAVEWLSKDFLLFHAGAVAANQIGIILPGHSGSGKSTLTAALIARGCEYFSDEAAVIDPASGLLLPFSKAIKLELDSLPVLRHSYPELIDIQPRATYLRPPDHTLPSMPVPPRHIVFPHYMPGAGADLQRLSDSEAFGLLLSNSFSARTQPTAAIEQIIQLLQGCDCYALTFDDLAAAVDLVLTLADRGDNATQPHLHSHHTAASQPTSIV